MQSVLGADGGGALLRVVSAVCVIFFASRYLVAGSVAAAVVAGVAEAGAGAYLEAHLAWS